MTNKFIKQYNYAEMSVLNVKSIKVTNGKNKDNIPLQVSPKARTRPDIFRVVLGPCAQRCPCKASPLGAKNEAKNQNLHLRRKSFEIVNIR